MSTFHVCACNERWVSNHVIFREKDSRKKTEDIVYYIILIIFSSIHLTNQATVALKVHLH